MTCSVSINVRVSSEGQNIPLQQLISDIERIASYHGKTITIKAVREHSMPSLIKPGPPLMSVIADMLADADAATSPHYRASPTGRPFPARVSAARKTFERGSKEFMAEAVRRSMPTVCRTREQYLRENWDALNATFGYSRGGYLDSQFRRMIAKQL